jgi:hypothetical protein
MSAIEKLKKRVTALEAELSKLKDRRMQNQHQPSGAAWLNKIYGAFANDLDYLEAMRLGREYRESLKPKPRKRKKRKGSHVDS